MSEIASRNIHHHLLELLEQHQARYRLVEHEASGKCEAVSEIRGTALGQGAKALVCKIKGNGVKMHVLAILAADQQADLSRLAEHFGGNKASLASPVEVDDLTACVFGAIPPFSFHPSLNLVADPLFLTATKILPSMQACSKSRSFSTRKIIYALRVLNWLSFVARLNCHAGSLPVCSGPARFFQRKNGNHQHHHDGNK
jgi:Ala-tRNA(Pro) deacylase